MSRVGGVGHSLTCLTVLEAYRSWRDGRLQSITFSAEQMQPALVLGSGSSTPDGDGAGEDGLNDGGAGVHHHCLWQVDFLQLPQEVHPLLGFFGE